MPQPFNAYLEVESTYTGGILFGTFNDYFAATSSAVTVQSAPAGGTVRIAGSNNNILAEAGVGAAGTASLEIGAYSMPINGASLQAYDQSGSLVATTGTTSIWGGDVFLVPAPSGGGSGSLTISTQDSNGRTITGYFTLLYQNGNLVSTGFSPFTHNLVSGAIYNVQIANYGSCFFNHWSDTGDASSQRTFTAISGAQTFTAVYNCGGGGGGGGGSSTSTLSILTTDGSGTQIAGLYVTLWQAGVMIKSCFSSCSFTVNNGQSYQVAVADFGHYSFKHWTDGTTTRFHTVSVPSSSSQISLTATY
jgi:hypothetical protein